jgi:hypothetical protein
MTMKVEMTHIVEEEDGGKRYVFEMNEEGVDHMVTLGLELALSCAIYGVDPRVVLDGIPSMPKGIDGPYSPEAISEMFSSKTIEV